MFFNWWNPFNRTFIWNPLFFPDIFFSTFPHVTHPFYFHLSFLFIFFLLSLSLFFLGFFFFFFFFLISIRCDIRNGSAFRKVSMAHSICPFFHATRTRTAPAKITHVKVGCINYSRTPSFSHGVPIGRAKKISIPRPKCSYTRATILTPNTRNTLDRARHFPLRDFHPRFPASLH